MLKLELDGGALVGSVLTAATEQTPSVARVNYQWWRDGTELDAQADGRAA